MVINEIIKDNKNYKVRYNNYYTIVIKKYDFVTLNIDYKSGKKIFIDLNNTETVIYKYLYGRIKDDAINYLSYSLKSKKQVIQKLQGKFKMDNIIKDVADYLESIGYINDALYSRKYIYDRKILNPRAPRMIRLELIAKGVRKSIVDQAINEQEFDEFEEALNIAKKKFKNQIINDFKSKQKLYRLLNYRGYNSEVINRVYEEIKEEEDIEEENF